MGLADDTGKILFEPIYNKMILITNEINGENQGIINLNNKQIVELKYSSIYLIENKIFKCNNEDSRHDLYSISGKLLGNFKSVTTALLEKHHHRDNSSDYSAHLKVAGSIVLFRHHLEVG